MDKIDLNAQSANEKEAIKTYGVWEKTTKRVMPYTFDYTIEGAKRALFENSKIKDWSEATEYGYKIVTVGKL